MRVKMAAQSGYTAIPNEFIDTYMSKANPTFVVIYIYFFRHSLTGGSGITTKAAADAFGILESDVVNCFKFWEQSGLMKVSECDGDYDITFLEVAGRQETSRQEPVKPVKAEKEVLKPERIRPVLLETRPLYTVDELEIYQAECEEVKQLFGAAEQVFGKLLKYDDLNILFGIYDWLRLPLPVIERLLKYCADNGHLNMRYIEKAAIDWAEQGIDSVDAAEQHINTFNVDYREILKAFGQSRRNPTPTEIKYMSKWLRDYKMPLAIILEACEKTVMQTGQAKFPYCDKIMTSWYEKGVQTLDDVKKQTDEFYEIKGGKAKEKVMRAPAKNRFANFEQRDWDFDAIEKAELARLQAKTMKGQSNGIPIYLQASNSSI